MTKTKRMIAPRLANKNPRVPFGARFPEPIKEGLRRIARNEGKSMNWVMEEVIIDYFNMERPRYKGEK